MVHLSELATEKIKAAIAAQSDSYIGIRVSVSDGGCSGYQYQMDLVREGAENDQVVEASGLKIFVDPASASYLKGTEIDYEENLQAAGFKFKNPNVKGTCGCGESFHV